MRALMIAVAASAALFVTACGEPVVYNHNGFQTAEEACAVTEPNNGGTIVQGPYPEDDGREAVCSGQAETGQPIQVESEFYQDSKGTEDGNDGWTHTWKVEAAEHDDSAYDD